MRADERAVWAATWEVFEGLREGTLDVEVAGTMLEALDTALGTLRASYERSAEKPTHDVGDKTAQLESSGGEAVD